MTGLGFALAQDKNIKCIVRAGNGLVVPTIAASERPFSNTLRIIRARGQAPSPIAVQGFAPTMDPNLSQ